MVELWMIFIGSAISITITFAVRKYDSHKNTQMRHGILKEAKTICEDLKAILNDVVPSGDLEEYYDIDSSLHAYFHENQKKIKQLMYELENVKNWHRTKEGKQAKAFVDMLEWITGKFYRYDCDEEERIRIWTKNVQEFHSRMTKILNEIKTN